VDAELRTSGQGSSSQSLDPVIDVGIPAWRHSPYLEQAIASVERQTLTSWRLHISQDGPPESSVRNLIVARGDPRIVYSSTGSALGSAKHKSLLIRTGRAPLVALLDHDDLWGPDFLRRRVEFLEADPMCAFVFSPLTVIDADGNVVGQGSRLLADGVYSSSELVPVLLTTSGIPGGSVVARRAAYEDVGGEFCDFLPRTYDYEMWIRLALRFAGGYLGLWDVCWRRHGANASARLDGCDKEYERLVSHVSGMVRQQRPDLPSGDEIWRRKLSALLLMTSLDALTLGQRRLARQYLSQAIRRDVRGSLRAPTLAAVLTVGLGRPGAAIVAGARRIKHVLSGRRAPRSTSIQKTPSTAASDRGNATRLKRAARKLTRDPVGFFALLEDRIERHARALAADPVESLILLRERVADRAELRGKRTMGGGVMPWPPCPYKVDENWEEMLHQIIGAPWPCAARDDFWQLWPKVIAELEGTEGVHLGRGAFAGWGDGEPALVRAVWCLTHHLRPAKVVETGVARGITTRFLLEALERNGTGHLWSIDLPPPLDRSLHTQIGLAVPRRLYPRWTYVRGSTRRRLPKVLARIGPIDLFVHDSTHTARNLLFELAHAWAALSPDGVAVADDVDLNCGFHDFQRDHARHASLVCHAEPLHPDYPRQDERGIFAIVRKSCGT